MRVLIVSNAPTSMIAKQIGLGSGSAGSWVEGAISQLKKLGDINISLCFPLETKEIVKGEVDNISYYSFFIKTNKLGLTNPCTMHSLTDKHFKEIIKEAYPDVLHVFGTEFAYLYQAVKAFDNPSHTLVHIQGLTSECAKSYYANVSPSFLHIPTVSSVLRGTISGQKKRMEKRGEIEKMLLKSVSNVAGRTDWDYACTKMINPELKYYHCGEILRSDFYSENLKWKYSSCKKHSIFVSQATYPIKGVHMLLEAMSMLKKEYPDIELVVGGNNPIKDNSIKGLLMLSPYGLYLRKLLKKYDLKDRVHFVGALSSSQMIEKFLSANVYVQPSSIENSPNSLGEAMILGMPCVCSFVGGVSSMLEDRKEGFLYPFESVASLASYISKVFSAGEEVELLGEKAIKHANFSYDPQMNCAQLKKIYYDINK